MMIDKVGGINPLQNVQNTRKTSGAENVKLGKDSITVSDEAKRMADLYYLKQVASETPDVRLDKIAEVKQKIQDPNYLTKEVLDSAADRLMASFGL